jgi:hypothetical protein
MSSKIRSAGLGVWSRGLAGPVHSADGTDVVATPGEVPLLLGRRLPWRGRGCPWGPFVQSDLFSFSCWNRLSYT